MPTFPDNTPLVSVRSLLNETGLRKNNFAATEAPNAAYDSRFGWEVGSRIMANGVEYICTNDTPNAAEWPLANDASAAAVAQEAKDGVDAIAPNVRKNNFNATRAPLPSDNEAQGYEPGSQWVWQGQAWLRTVSGWVPDKLRLMPEMFGAVGDATALDNAAFSAAAALGRPVETADKGYRTTLGVTALPKAIDGDGVVWFGAGNKLAKSWRLIDTPSMGEGDEASFATAFNGDWSRTFAPRAVQVSGAATLGQPTTGFTHNIEAIPYYLYMRNVDSGHNESLIGNGGRTTWPGFRIRGFHSWQGGMMGFSSSIFVNGQARPGVTSFLANPAAANLSASGYAGANGVYLNPLEINCQDQGFDVAAIGPVINMQRTNKGGAMEAFWSGMRIQSIGSEAINSGYQISGRADTGIDFTKADFSSGTEAAIALKAGHRIYFESTSANNWHKTQNGDTWLAYSTANSGLELFVDGSEVVRARATGVLIRNAPLQIETGNLALQSAAAIVTVGGVRVLTTRKLGWTAPTGNGAKSAFDTETATTLEVARRLKAVIDDLISHGLIGA